MERLYISVRRWILALAAVFGGMSLVMMSTSSANAAVYNTSSYHKITVVGAVGYAWEAGDKFKLCDTKANGRAAKIQIEAAGSTTGYVRSVSGSGNCITFYHNLPENRRIHWHVFGCTGTGCPSGSVINTSYYNDH
ncbi:hypothetical protein WBG06_15830 [Nocardioides sp. CCNWLW239]|uniref:hypothetical protein n=1 Tax=Nocardioides sp. CCNWLW239 TaxID=3128902 RepID=UPI00301981D9